MNRVLGFAIAALGAGRLSAQGTDVTAQLRGRVPPPVVLAAQSLADSAARAGVPAGPLVQKALEGAAKNVTADRVVAALQTLLGREIAGRLALRRGGMPSPAGPDVEGATFALSAGLSDSDVSSLARASGGGHGAATTLRVAGTLAAMGVPAAGTVQLLSAALAAGVPPGELGSFPGSVEAAMTRGMTPAQAAAGLSRSTQARAGTPAGRGRPGPR